MAHARCKKALPTNIPFTSFTESLKVLALMSFTNEIVIGIVFLMF